MADPEGPGRHAPRRCSTLTLADLGDTIGFREPGDALKIYGLRLDSKGYYSRVPVDHPDDDDWDVQLELRRGVTYLEHNTMLVRLENLGKALVSYQACKTVIRGSQPVTTSQSFLKVFSPRALLYCVGATEIKAKTKLCLKANTEFDTDLAHLAKPPPGSTVYLELFIQPAAQTEPLTVLPGVSIKWGASTQGRYIALILTNSGAATERENGKWAARATEQDVVVELKEVGVDEIIFGTTWAFVRLLFSSSPVSDHRLEQLISQLKK